MIERDWKESKGKTGSDLEVVGRRENVIQVNLCTGLGK